MCTLVLIHRVVPGAPLMVLANRDEMIDRPSRGPQLARENPRVYCGLDGRDGGTWCGLNEDRLFVGLTNLTLRPPDATRRSRGLLCLDMLSHRAFEDIVHAMRSLATSAYNPFHLVAADGKRAIRVRYDDRPEVEELGPGVHATTNWPAGSEGDAKRAWAANAVTEVLRAREDVGAIAEGLRRMAGVHERDGDPRASICCHVPGYGTRSSSIIGVTSAGGILYQHSDGPPCEAKFVDLSATASRELGMHAHEPG